MKKTNCKTKNVESLFSGRNSLSRRNDVRITRIRQLQHRQSRDQQFVFLCEGARFLIKAFENGRHVESCVYAPDLFPTSYSDKLLRQLEKRGIPMLRVSKEVFMSISLADEPSGLLAVCRQKIRRLDRVMSVGPPAWLALDTVRSAGNLGTIMRTCEAAGMTGLILLDPATDPYHPAAVRASMGSVMKLTLVRATVDELFQWAKRTGVQVLASSPSGSFDYRQADYKHPTVILMGSERKGLQTELQQRCDHILRIPMPGTTDSLNLAVATGILLYELVSQRNPHVCPNQELAHAISDELR